MRLPPGIAESDFSAAMQQLRQIVGEDWVFTTDDDLEPYRDAYGPLWDQPGERLASAAVAPANAEQVQAIMRVANRTKLPIFTISTGKNLGYGGAAPNYSGSVMLDLKRLNRIIEVNEERAYVIVEPGVSYFDLYRHLRATRSRLWLDCPDPGWGSLVGNALEHGNGYTAALYRDHFAAHCGMEIVLADGELFRTGTGAIEGSKTWQDYRYNFGPYLDGIFSQSNFGIVTKMGFWLMPEPETYRGITLSAPRYEDVIPLLRLANRLELSGVVQGETPLMSAVMQPSLKGRWGWEPITPPDPELAAMLQDRRVGYPELEQYAKRHNMPFWTMELKCYGPAEITAAQMAHAKKLALQIPGVTVEPGPFYEFPLSDDQVRSVVYKAPLGILSLQMFTGEAVSGDRGHLLFSVQIPKTGEALIEAHKVFGQAFRDLGSNKRGEFFIPFDWVSRSLGIATAFPMTRDPAKDRDALEMVKKLTGIATRNGWAEYRSHAIVQDHVMASYNFNDNILRRLCERLKDALDPNGVLAAGRYGIWPQSLRGAKL